MFRVAALHRGKKKKVNEEVSENPLDLLNEILGCKNKTGQKQ